MPMQKITADSPDAKSADIVAQNLDHLRRLFPDAWVEGKVDFDVLRQLLGGAVDAREEKFGLNWHGKRKARQLALTPSTGTLRPCPNESVDWDTTKNLMIEGDNLEVLKLLQKSYADQVKMIYIDPPYNTGKDFVYADDFQDNIKNYLEITGQIKSGKKLVANTEASGRFHTDWLSMMLPRLRLAANLLSKDGLIFISIDDNEADNLKKLCDEVFGEENFISQFVWNTDGHTDNQFDVKVNHEYILLYAKNADAAGIGHVVDPNTREESNLWKGFAENSITKNGPGNPPSSVTLPAGFPCLKDRLELPENRVSSRFFEEVKEHGYITRELTEKYSLSYPIRLGPLKVESGKLATQCTVYSGWANANKLRAFISNGCQPIDESGDKLSFYLSDKGVIYYRRDRTKARNILSVLRGMGTTEKMRSELEEMGIPFQYPKPKELLSYLIQVGVESNGLILDFFAGSGSTAHAAFLQNIADQISRRFILVQLPEPLSAESQQAAVQFCDKLKKPRNIAELTKERLRRTAKAVKNQAQLFPGDFGFRVYKLDSSNIREWDPKRDDMAATLDEHAEHLKSGRTEEDILTELLLKLGIDLCVPIESRKISEATVYSIGAGTLFACLPEKITRAQVKPLAQGILAWRQELKVAVKSEFVFRDSAFADDVAKTNLTAYLEQNLPEAQRGRIRSL